MTKRGNKTTIQKRNKFPFI